MRDAINDVLYVIFSVLIFCFAITLMINAMKTEWMLNQSYAYDQQNHETTLVSRESPETDRTVSYADIIFEIRNSDYVTIRIEGSDLPEDVISGLRNNDIDNSGINDFLSDREYEKKEIYSSDGQIIGIEYI